MLNLVSKTYAASTLREILNNVDFTKSDKKLEDINGLVIAIIKLALDLAGVVAFIMILYSVFLFATSYGEEGKIEPAKKTLYWSIAGLAVIAVAYFITNLLNKYLK
jgi:small-conductance mechanosensitive channel